MHGCGRTTMLLLNSQVVPAVGQSSMILKVKHRKAWVTTRNDTCLDYR